MTDLTAERIKELREQAVEDVKRGERFYEGDLLNNELLALLSRAERHHLPEALPDARSLEGGETFSRFELIDHTGAEPRGRVFVRHADLVIERSIQDEGRTLKIFLRSAS